MGEIMTTRIIGTGSAVPKQVVTNDDLAKIVDTSDEWIRPRTGIRERRIAAAESGTSDLAAEAAKLADQLAQESQGVHMPAEYIRNDTEFYETCLLYTSDAADEL